MSDYRLEVFGIEIVYADDHAATVKAFDECASEVTLVYKVHTPESWRELSAKIEEALLQIHPAK